jgi:hypothetical protein
MLTSPSPVPKFSWYSHPNRSSTRRLSSGGSFAPPFMNTLSEDRSWRPNWSESSHCNQRHSRADGRDPLPRYGRKHRLGRGALCNDRRPAMDQRAQNARTVERVIVRHRQHGKKHGVGTESGDDPGLGRDETR